MQGHIEDTASTSTLAALAAARELGAGAVVCSEQAHSSVEKAARLLALEVRKVPVDDEFRMRPDARAEALAEGATAAVVATVGTTSTTSVDPVPAVAELRERGRCLAPCRRRVRGLRRRLRGVRWAADGIERADSVVVNPHKWLFTPIDCSCLYTRRPEALRRAFSLVPEYLRTSEEDVTNLMEYGPALGRRFRALAPDVTRRSRAPC